MDPPLLCRKTVQIGMMTNGSRLSIGAALQSQDFASDASRFPVLYLIVRRMASDIASIPTYAANTNSDTILVPGTSSGGDPALEVDPL